MKLSTLMIGLAVIGLAAAGLSIPLYEHLHAERRRENARAAAGALEAITTAQTRYREGDLDGDKVLAYAPDLESLVRTGVLDPELGDGLHRGYRLTLRHHQVDRFIWSATAEPVVVGQTGDLFLGSSMAGVIHFSREGPLVFEEDGSPPGGAITISK